MLEITLAILSGLVGAIAGMLYARYLWFSGTKERRADRRDDRAADDAAADHLIGLLERQNKLALENARLEYEKRLKEEMDKLRSEMNQRFNQLIDSYGCQTAFEGCENRVIPNRPLHGF